MLGQFIEFLACQGQQSAQQLGYSPLPPNLVDDDFQGIKRIAGAAPPPATRQRPDVQRPLRVIFRRQRWLVGRWRTEAALVAEEAARKPVAETGAAPSEAPQEAPRVGHRAGPNPGGVTGGTGGQSKTGGHHSGRGGTSSGRGSSHTGTSTTQPGSTTTESTATIAAEQQLGLALFRRGTQLATVPRPVAPMLYISFGFLLLVAVPPTVLWIRSRRRRRSESVSQNHRGVRDLAPTREA